MSSRAFALPLLALLLVAAASAQEISLTPEQQLLLNQLPPAQRQMALDAIRRNAGSQSATELSSLNEELLPAAVEQTQTSSPPVEEELATGGSQLILSLTLPDDADQADVVAVEQDTALSAVEGSRFYQLDESGTLHLPGLTSIPLRGLNEDQIASRLAAEPELRSFTIDVVLLGRDVGSTDTLEQFGYELFESATSSFNPVSTGPVPSDYVLGPGDSVRVQLFGNQNDVYEYEVTRDGILNLPELGPITVAGLSFAELRRDISRRVEASLIGTQASVTLGRLRSMRVFVLGDANQPGSYVVNSLATISTALYFSGGVSRVGSLRDIQLKRNGQVIARLDLYDLLLNGDTSGDVRLQPGDAVFIPPVGPRIGISGAVKRPGVYETRGDTSLAAAMKLAGGLEPDAYPGGARLERVRASDQRRVLSVDAGGDVAATTLVQDGDVLSIPTVLPEFENSVTLEGHVHRPGLYQWRRGMRLTDLLQSDAVLKPGADRGYVLIRREQPGTGRLKPVSANLAAAFADASSDQNVTLEPRDTVYVFSVEFGKQRSIAPFLRELKLQAQYGSPLREVSVSGRVRSPGLYPMEESMRVSDLLRAGGGLAEDAYTLKAELARYVVESNEFRRVEVLDVDLAAVLRGDAGADVVLKEYDNLRISTVRDWDAFWTVMIEGEVKFPGTYRIREGEKLSQLLGRAGGLTDGAFPAGAVFLRESLRQREQEQVDVLARRLEADLTSLSLQTLDTTGAQTLSTGRALLEQLRSTKPVGRLVIDFEWMTAENGDRRTRIARDVELRDGDRLLVPKKAQEVTVIGETQQNTSHLYEPGLRRADYIAMSGGYTRRADKKLVYVVRANGAVVASSNSSWLGRNRSVDIRPGDTIVVPLETDRIRPLTFWTNATQILYQAAIAIAAVDSFND